LSIAFVYFFIPETRGKTLEEMDAAFGSHANTEDMEELESIQREVGLTDLLTEGVRGFADVEKVDSVYVAPSKM
jgi:hypothetical protein